MAEEVTVKETFNKVIYYVKIVASNKLWIVGAMLLVGSILGAKAYFSEKKYEATLTFMVNDESGGGGSGLSTILGQFGLGGGGGSQNYKKIVEIANSNKILTGVLMSSSSVDGKSYY